MNNPRLFGINMGFYITKNSKGCLTIMFKRTKNKALGSLIGRSRALYNRNSAFAVSIEQKVIRIPPKNQAFSSRPRVKTTADGQELRGFMLITALSVPIDNSDPIMESGGIEYRASGIR